jgi:hypothetical protein
MTEARTFLPKGVLAMAAVLVAGLALGAMFMADDDLFHLEINRPNRTQPSEIRGRWLGMSVAATNSSTATNWRLDPQDQGVVVAEVSAARGGRISQAGLRPGDVLVGIDGQQVRDMGEFFDVTNGVDVGQPILLDIERGGQPMTLVVPAGTGTPQQQVAADFGAVAAPPAYRPAYGPGYAQGYAQQPPTIGTIPGYGQAQSPRYQPARPLVQRGQSFGGGRGAWSPPGPGAIFSCPLHGLAWGAADVHPHYRCPHCNSSLARVR